MKGVVIDMAYTMAHVWAAEKALKYIPEIKEHSTYILGTIAPDAVHANPDYTTELKEKSHLFTENLKWGMIGSWIEAEEWLGNIRKFYRENRMAYDQDFLLGYIVHLFVDVYNSLYFYGPFMESIKCDREKTLARYKKEAFGINYYLYSLYAREKDLRTILDSGRAVTLNGIIDKKDILKRVDDLSQYEFRNQDISDISEYKICTIEGTERLIEDASLFVKMMFSDEVFAVIS